MPSTPDPSERWPWERLRRQCLREARRYTLTPADAEDAVQEALARAWKKRDRCRDPEHVAGWLLAITRNEALRLRGRAAGELERRERLQRLGLAPTSHDAPDRDAIRRVDVRRALSNLGEAERRLVLLRYAADLTQPAAAAVVGVPEGTAKFQLHRSRSILRGMLTADDH